MLTHLKRWLLRRSLAYERTTVSRDQSAIKTQFSATVFTGESEPWVSYLATPRQDRYDPDVRLTVLWSGRNRLLFFREENEASHALAECLNDAFVTLRQKARSKPFVAEKLDEMLFANEANGETDLDVRVSESLPSQSSREILFGESLSALDVKLVLRQSLVDPVLAGYRQAGCEAEPGVRLGHAWPLVLRLLTQLSYPNQPRDRFVERIDQTTRNCLIAINTLYKAKRRGRLVPTQVGSVYEEYVGRQVDIDPRQLFETHPYFRLLNELSFMLDERRYKDYLPEARVLVREYLDARYLRLSLAGMMPGVTTSMAPMPYCWDDGEVATPPPEIGRYGILDKDDLTAWKKVDHAFRDIGFTLLRQVGMGEFGRVYEALNQSNPRLPDTVAIKVDRLRRWKKAKAIQQIETALQIGRDLAPSPHVIRVFDAGRLTGKKYTYHILQFVDGDTLDNLIGVTGQEHASVHRPESAHRSERDVQAGYSDAIRRSAGEAWRRRRQALPFTGTLSLSQTMDLLTSVLLWLEETHHLGYAINDLKNGNLMVSRRGQLKGIDIDAYAPVMSPLDKVTDFFFFAVSLLLLFRSVAKDTTTGYVSEQSVANANRIRREIHDHWAFADVSAVSSGRASNDEVIDLFTDLIDRSRNRMYAHNPDQFSDDLNRLIRLKRTIFLDEIVLD
jgi:hypothetical protein